MSNEGGSSEPELSEAEKSQVRQDPPPTWVGWGARLISVTLIGGLFLYLLTSGLTASAPPTVELSEVTQEIVQHDEQWAVPVVVKNTGDVSIGSVAVTAEMVASDGTVLESNNVVLALMGQGGSFDVEFWFSSDPADHEIHYSVGGFVIP